jgi:HD superfamily phosphodiesterase
MKLPTREQCLEYYRALETPQNIMNHVIKVNKVAVFLAKELKKKGIDIDVDLVDKASLLHDLDKWLCLNDESLVHGFETEKILTEKGYPEIGFYARQHRIDLILNGLKTWEEKVINYADKRILNDKVVSMKERIDYINKRYPSDDKEKEKKIRELSFKEEELLFSKLDIEPDDLSKYIK